MSCRKCCLFLTVIDSIHCLSQAYISRPFGPKRIRIIYYKLWKIYMQSVDEKIHIHQWQWSRAESQHLI